MRAMAIGIAVVVASSAPALAGGIQTMPGHLIPYASTSDAAGSAIPTVTRGASFDIACDSITSRSADVRVVMALDDSDAAPAGFSAVLATKQKLTRHGVHVVVPDVADLADRTVNVKVYVTDGKNTKACDAGRVHIG